MVRVWTVVATLLAATAATAAHAAPGELMSRGADEPEPLVILDAPADPKCTKVCFAAGARTTIAVESQSDTPKAATSAPRFARAASVAARDGAAHSTDGAWTLTVDAALKRPALAGNAMFMLFDLDDPDALPNRQFTALYQHDVKAQKSLAVRLSLAPDEGFHAGHTYRLRIVQLVGGKELLLAEGDVTLL